MKFLKRRDLDAGDRLWMAARMSQRGFDDRGMVSELARRRGASRQFLYDNWRLRLDAARAGDAPSAGDAASAGMVNKLILCLRLYCAAPVGGISRTIREMGWGPGSPGHIPEFLRGVAESVRPAPVPALSGVALTLDETFANGRPILVSMEASSHHILSIRLAPDRGAAAWEKELRAIQESGVGVGLLVEDQGSSLKAAAKALGLASQADLFHLLKPFDPFAASIERHAYGAIGEADARRRVPGNRRTAAARGKAVARLAAAEAAEAAAIRASDNYSHLHGCLHESFDSFAPDGRPRTRAEAEADIGAALSLLGEEFPGHAGVADASRAMLAALPEYMGYFDRLDSIMSLWPGLVPEETRRAVCLAWQLDRKAMAVKRPEWRRRPARQAREWMALALDGGEADGAALALRSALDANHRSSSPLEAVNSVIRATLNACRGQVTQASLDMLAFAINHRRAERGKYAGASPYERMTGLREPGSPVEQLMAAAAGKWRTMGGGAKAA